MSASHYESLKEHIGHKIVCVSHGEGPDPANVAVECEDCKEVLVSFDRPEASDAAVLWGNR